MIPPLISHEVARFRNLNASTLLTPWVGIDPYSWAESVNVGLGSQHGLSTTPMSRSALRNLWANTAASDEACFLSTMAWGGMQRGNGRRVWHSRGNWLQVCRDVRAGMHTRSSGYAAFLKLRTEDQLPGMGPAYFTKILFFASHKADAYILDQWTTRSIHLLSGQSRFPLLRKDYASAKAATKAGDPTKLRLIVDGNVPVTDYLDYCSRVEDLAKIMSLHPHEVEERLFSSGGKKPHPWRVHVMTAWNKSTPSLYP